MPSTIENVRKICREKGIPISRIEKDLGYGNGYLNPKKAKSISYERIIEISKYLQVPASRLTGESGETPVAPEGGGLDSRIAKLPDSFQRRLSDFLLLAQEHPDSAERFLAFAVQELQSAAQDR